MIKKKDMKSSSWIKAYEKHNVSVGLNCGFSGLAQIGKGMFAEPDNMSKMLNEKIGHLVSGANCAWVPSPTAAAIHSLHYHDINIFEKHKSLINKKPPDIENLLRIPIINRPNWGEELSSKYFGLRC